jgi:hypothetical protein
VGTEPYLNLTIRGGGGAYAVFMVNWYESLEDAVTAARKLGRPILSLRMLGRLDQELSCANSRFFRTTLYPDARVAELLAARVVLHVRSVRPVPVVTIDFGDGRNLVRTVTGNSVHLVLDQHGRPVDALPGLFDAGTFVRLVGAACEVAAVIAGMSEAEREARLAQWHRERRAEILRAWALDLGSSSSSADALEAASDDETWARLAAARATGALPSDRSEIQRRFPSARAAGELAVSKRLVERPLVDLLEPLARSIAEDTLRNQYRLHRRVHERFVAGGVGDAAELEAWSYRELFLMPPEDPWLGLRPPAFAAVLEEVMSDREDGSQS